MRAFLELCNGEWLDDFVYSSWYELYCRGFEIVKFDGDDLEGTLLNKNLNKDTDIIVGSVEATVKFFEACDINAPEYLGYPDSLRKYLNRDIQVSKFKDVDKGYPYFMKPATNIKQFTGDVIQKDSHIKLLQDFHNLNEDTNVYVGDVVDFKSEYRCFVYKGQLKGVQYYLGDFRQYIDCDVVENMVQDYKDSPIAYTLDVGYVEGKGTTLIEVNDMWAIGAYGFNRKEYVNMIVSRMQELKK